LSARTNQAGIESLSTIVEPYDYRVKVIETSGCLHLKTACSYLGRQTILVNRHWIDVRKLAEFDLPEFDLVDVPEVEPWGANTLTIAGVVLIADGFPRTRALLEERGFTTNTVDISEFQKAEAGLTCLSLIFQIQ